MKLPKNITPDWINRQINQTQNAGYQYPTEMELYQQKYAGLVISNSLRNGGQIRTLQEINDYLAQKYSIPEYWTQEQYDTKLSNLIKDLASRITFSGVRADIRADCIQIIKDMNAEYDTHYNPYTMSTEDLHNAIREAGNYSRDIRGRGGDTAAAFYGRLEEELQAIEERRRR